MSLSRISFPAVFALTLTAAAPPTVDPRGDWRNTRDTVHMRVAACGEALCATVIWASDKAKADARKGSGQDLVGSRLLSDLRRHANGRWKGKAYVPDIDVRASAVMVPVKPNLLRVSGCILGGLICRTAHWHRMG